MTKLEMTGTKKIAGKTKNKMYGQNFLSEHHKSVQKEKSENTDTFPDSVK